MRALKKSTWAYITKVYALEQDKVDKWCDESIGARHQEWFSYINKDSGKWELFYAFREPTDLLTFKLAWGDNEH